jgi:hypothetical protein
MDKLVVLSTMAAEVCFLPDRSMQRERENEERASLETVREDCTNLSVNAWLNDTFHFVITRSAECRTRIERRWLLHNC